MTPLLLFVTGRERSGTTLLQNMLNLHAEMVIAPESTFIWDLLPVAKKRAEHYFENPSSFIRLLQKDVRFNLWKLDNKLIHEQIAITTKIVNRTYQDLLLAVLKAYGISEGKTTPKVIGIKHPAISMFLPEILAAFPKAHVLHIVRDYRDVLHSLLQLPFETQNIFTMSHRWLSYNRSYQRVAEKEPEKCTLLRYEDLVHDPANALRPFLEKHELKWQNEMLNVAQYLMQKQADHAILEKYQKHLTQPVTNQLIGKGKLALTKKQLRVAESICGTFGQHHYGYEMTKKPFQINWLASFVVKFWASLYFKVEKFSNKLPPSLKLQYLNLKNLSAARWHRDLINKSQ